MPCYNSPCGRISVNLYCLYKSGCPNDEDYGSQFEADYSCEISDELLEEIEKEELNNKPDEPDELDYYFDPVTITPYWLAIDPHQPLGGFDQINVAPHK